MLQLNQVVSICRGWIAADEAFSKTIERMKF